MLILFDIDGTLADGRHREGLLAGDNPDWAAFIAASKYDPVFPAMKAFMSVARQASSGHNPVGRHAWYILFATGRSELFRELTREWIRTNFEICDPDILMRAEDDVRHDTDVKRDMLADIVRDFGQLPDMAFEDRLPVAELYREHGIYTCHVASGDPWAGKPFPSGDALRALVPPA